MNSRRRRKKNNERENIMAVVTIKLCFLLLKKGNKKRLGLRNCFIPIICTKIKALEGSQGRYTV